MATAERFSTQKYSYLHENTLSGKRFSVEASCLLTNWPVDLGLDSFCACLNFYLTILTEKKEKRMTLVKLRVAYNVQCVSRRVQTFV